MKAEHAQIRLSLESCATLDLYQRRLRTLEERQIEHSEGAPGRVMRHEGPTNRHYLEGSLEEEQEQPSIMALPLRA